MESPSEVKRSTPIITIQPNETILTAFPYGPHTSLLDFLKGEPKVLGAIQILFALIIACIGSIFAFNYLYFSQRFPLVFLTGYPFWGAFIFIITGYLTGINNKEKFLGQGVVSMNVISSLVAVAGIILTIISFRHQHDYCQTPSVEGLCVIGRILFNGILSVLLIISIAELSISVTIASFGSKCWTKSNEIVFFFPSDVTQESEFSVPEENAVIQFELQEESSSENSVTNIQPFFFGGYTFFKLKVLSNPLALQQLERRGSNSNYTSVFVPDEPQKSIPPPLKLYEEEVEPKPLPPILEKRPSENIVYTEKFTDEDLKSAMIRPPEMQTQLLQAQDLPVKVFPSHYVKQLQMLPTQDLPSQALPAKTLPVQALLSEAPTSHVTQSHSLTSEDMPSQDIPSQDKQSQDMPSQDTQSLDMSSQYTSSPDMLSQNIPCQDMPPQDMLSQVQVFPAQAVLFKAPAFHPVQSPSIHNEKSPDLQLQNIQPQDQQFKQVSYQSIQSEVMLLTQEWKPVKELQGKKSPKEHSLGCQGKGMQSPKHKSLNLQTQDHQSSKTKSLDKHIICCLSLKRHSIDKQVHAKQTTQTAPDQPAEDQLAQGEQSLKQQSQNVQSEDQQERSPKEQTKSGQDKDQQAVKEKSSKKQTQHQQDEDQQVQQEKSPKQLCQDWQSEIQEYQDWQSPRKQSPDWKTQGWQSLSQQSQGCRNKDWKAQEWQFEMQHSLNWGSQAWQVQDLLEKESLRQKALFQEAQTLHALTRHHLDSQLPDFLFQNNQCQEKDQQDFQSTSSQEEYMQIDTMQTRDIKPGDMKSQCQNPSDLQAEDGKPDFHFSSCQSSVQDTDFASLSNIDSEKDVQQNVSICSTSYKEDPSLTSASSYPKDQQQSEDSD
uniref:Membrane spanning 4-domains A14 n=1 Tax=Equus caballus TaxID=9796 RepID=F6Q3M1_HORSE|nr:membrane-spanning 4-domains subfamily A member 14 [Equus caballus]